MLLPIYQMICIQSCYFWKLDHMKIPKVFFSLSRESVSGLAFCSLGHSSTVDSCTMWALDALTPVHSKVHIELYSQPSL